MIQALAMMIWRSLFQKARVLADGDSGKNANGNMTDAFGSGETTITQQHSPYMTRR